MRPASELASELLEIVPDRWRVSTSAAVLEQHAGDLTYLEAKPPEVVVYPESTEEVSRVLAYANERGVPVTPFGMGTSVEGQVIPLGGGISLDLTRMDRVVEVRPSDLQADVQPGTRRSQLARVAGEHGLFFPVDPGADATLGGMAATAASGTTTVRYGGMRAQVLGLQVVLADGTAIRTGGRVVKSSAGYDLSSLFVGSEGTLGVITGLTLRLFPILDYVAAVQAAFPDPHAACRAAATMVGAGVLVSRCEYVGGEMIAMMNAYKGSSLREEPHLWIEFGGASEAAVAADVEAAREIAIAESCTSFQAETDHSRRRRIWETRHDALHAIDADSPGRKLYLTDVCVPISQLPDAFQLAPRLLEESGLVGALVGHAGDGNYHFGLTVDPACPEELEKAKRLNQRIVADALARGGTCTGEHGIGIGKRSFLEQEHGDAIPAMRAIKLALDPNGILNPGKVV